MRTLLLLLFLPAVLFGQKNLAEGKKTGKTLFHPPHAAPINVINGKVVNATYRIVYDTTDEISYFDLVIHTHSYREALKPSDGEALFIADGLGKVFEILHWTSQNRADKIVSSIVIRMNREEFKSISYAGTVGLKIGANSFMLPHMARHNMRMIIAQMESSSGNKSKSYKPPGIKVYRLDISNEPMASGLKN